MLSGLFVDSQQVTLVNWVLALQKSEILMHDWKRMEITGSGQKLYAIYTPVFSKPLPFGW